MILDKSSNYVKVRFALGRFLPLRTKCFASASLADQGHDIFFDREDLLPGVAYDARIRQAIEHCDLFVFMLSPDAIDTGSYTLTEQQIAQKSFARPSGRVLPVMLRAVPYDQIPPFLKSVTLLQPDGNVAASVADAVYRLAQVRRRALLTRLAAVSAVVLVALAGAWFYWAQRGPDTAGKDGAPLVRVPAGTYIVGDDEESPQRQVFVSNFHIDRHEVTVARYAKFLKASGWLKLPDEWDQVVGTHDATRDPVHAADLPVIGVDWRDADAYCRWAGRRLPTSTEWEIAARGTDARRYPWGNEDPSPARANFGKPYAKSAYKEGLEATGGRKAGRSPFGVDDLAGNVSEWVSDWYSESLPTGDVRDPKGPASGDKKIIRGGGWYDPASGLKSTQRFYADIDRRSDDLGFRCARDG